MILVPNHRQPLNGNNWLLLSLLASFICLSSCELLKPLPKDTPDDKNDNTELETIQGRKVYDPATGTFVEVENASTEQMDTIIWKDIPSSLEPPIFSTAAPIADNGGGVSNPVRPIGVGEAGSQLLSSYNVAVVLPFLSNRFNASGNNISNNSEWALQFYSGMQMAFDELSKEGIALNVSVLDSKASETTVGALARNNTDINNAHLVIGPYRRNNVAIVADKMQVTSGVMVSPHSASSNVAKDNPNYVQVNPTLQSHCEAIMNHVYGKYNRSQIVLVGMDVQSETDRFEYFQREYQRLNGLTDTVRLRELVVDTAKLDMQSVDLKPWLGYDSETVFIVPSWSSEVFIYNFLRKLDLDKPDYQRAVVYGMPQWMSYEQVDFDYFEKLNVHVSSSSFIDDFDADIQAFKRDFYDRFGAIPNDEAFSAYDITMYFAKRLHEDGTKFQYLLEGEPTDMLHTTFDFRSVLNATTSSIERPLIQRWENKYVNILQFKNYRFQRAD